MIGRHTPLRKTDKLDFVRIKSFVLEWMPLRKWKVRMGENICKSWSNKGVIYIHNSYNSIIKQTTQFKNEQMDLNRHFSKNDIQVAKKHITSYQGNANQTHNETTSYPLGWLSSKSRH